MNRSFTTLLAGLLTASFGATAQELAAPTGTTIERRADGTPSLVQFADGAAPRATEAAALLRRTLGLGAQSELRAARPLETDELGFRHQQYQQYYRGVPVEHAFYTTHERGGNLEFLTGEIRPLADGALDVQPALSAEAALAAARRYVGAAEYEATTTAPQLVIADNVLTTDEARHGRPVLAWKLDVYGARPVSRAWIYVDAHSGEVVYRDAIIKHAAGSFVTRYSGTRTVQTTYRPATANYSLRDATRGSGVETYNLRKGNSLANAVDFVDANNSWTATEYNNTAQDWVAGDAHFGAACSFDYWKNQHARNSFDNAGAKIKSYVHFDDTPGDGAGYDNAFWNGAEMIYGDGNTTFKPLPAVDVCAHELGHAVCQYTANLTYQNESGGMNEGFSDIWGACVEQYAVNAYGLTGKSTWLIGEQVMQTGHGAALRSMSNPNQFGQPDTYQGTNWVTPVAHPDDTNDYGGVHTNSGVLNFWFYLLSVGGTGTNDKGNTYAVTGIGLTKAAKIAYLTEKLLTPTADYRTCRDYAVIAAGALYGYNSPEVLATTNAWYAVGLGYSRPLGNTSGGFIDAVALNQLFRTSGAETNGYFDGTGQSAVTVPTMAKCGQQTMVLSAGFGTSAAGTRYWNVYVDFNQDKDFNDANERVVTNQVSTTANWFAASFTVPAGALLGTTRMRVMMSTGPNPAQSGSIGFGEVEDYAVTVTAAAPLPAPTGVVATPQSSTSVKLTWTAVPNAATYYVQYRVSGAPVWQTAFGSSATNYLVTGLLAGTTYQFKVTGQSACANGLGSATVTATTPLHRAAPAEPTTAQPGVSVTAEAWPNPATTTLQLRLVAMDLHATAPAIGSVTVYDLRSARQQVGPLTADGALDISNLPAGVYTATVTGGAAPAHVRFVKE